MVHVGWVARCYTYSPPARVPHWSSGGGIQTTQDFVHNGSYGVGGWMMNFDSIGGHRGFEGWWGMYVKKGAHYTTKNKKKFPPEIYIQRSYMSLRTIFN